MKESFAKGITEIRTNVFTAITKYAVFLLCVSSLARANHIDKPEPFIKNVLIQSIHVYNLPAINITGLTSHQINDIRVKATFSPDKCDNNERDLHIINEKHNHNRNENQNTTELIISLGDFSFNEHQVAYLCIKLQNIERFIHLGVQSKFKR